MALARLFLGVPPDAHLRTQMAMLSTQLGSQTGAEGVRWTRPDNYHLTLVFLGATESDQVSAIHQCVLEAALELAPFSFTIRDVSWFPDAHRPRVIAMLPSVPEQFALWHDQLAGRLESAGLHRETRAFHPHWTLARVKRTAPGLDADFMEIPGRAEQIVLYQSVSSEAGPSYVPLFSVSCGPPFSETSTCKP